MYVLLFFNTFYFFFKFSNPNNKKALMYNVNMKIFCNTYHISSSFNNRLGIPADIGNILSVSGQISSPFITST